MFLERLNVALQRRMRRPQLGAVGSAHGIGGLIDQNPVQRQAPCGCGSAALVCWPTVISTSCSASLPGRLDMRRTCVVSYRASSTLERSARRPDDFLDQAQKDALGTGGAAA